MDHDDDVLHQRMCGSVVAYDVVVVVVDDGDGDGNSVWGCWRRLSHRNSCEMGHLYLEVWSFLITKYNYIFDIGCHILELINYYYYY